jgi:hypothetical protein
VGTPAGALSFRYDSACLAERAWSAQAAGSSSADGGARAAVELVTVEARNLLLRSGLAHAKAEPESSILFVQASHDQVGVYRVTYLVAYSARSLQLRALLVREG